MKNPYFWLGIEADYDQSIIDAYETPVPLFVIDSTEADE